MNPTKEQIVHDLAMACVNGIVQDRVLKENRDSDLGIISVDDFVDEVVFSYKEAWDAIYSQIDVTDE